MKKVFLPIIAALLLTVQQAWAQTATGAKHYAFSTETIPSTTLSASAEVIVPALRIMMFRSAVKMRRGRMKESTGNEPEMKSVEFNATAELSFDCREVIWQSRISSPRRLANTKAGRLLLPDKSENGKGMTTTSPFTNPAMRGLLQGLTNLLPESFRLHNGLMSERGLTCLQKPCRQVCGQAQKATARCSSFCFVSPMYPPFKFFDKDMQFLNTNLSI